MDTNLIDNCLFKIFTKYKNYSYLEDIDYKEIIKNNSNFLDLCINFCNNYPYTIETREKYENTVLLPIINTISKKNQWSCLNHNQKGALNLKYKTLYSLLLNNYFNSFEKCLEYKNIIIFDIVLLWLCRKLIRYPSIETKLINLIKILYKKFGKIKNKKCNQFMNKLIYIGENTQILINEFKTLKKKSKYIENLFKDDKNDAINFFIETEILDKNEEFQDYYDNVYEEDYNYLSQCKKHLKLFQEITFKQIKIIK
jgi:hypothetical protein